MAFKMNCITKKWWLSNLDVKIDNLQIFQYLLKCKKKHSSNHVCKLLNYNNLR